MAVVLNEQLLGRVLFCASIIVKRAKEVGHRTGNTINASTGPSAGSTTIDVAYI
jgi:hypothetical protein